MNIYLMNRVMGCFTALFLLTSTCLFAQSGISNVQTDLKDGNLRINFPGIAGFGFEKGIGNGFTLRPEAGFGWPVILDSHHENDVTEYYLESLINPYLLVEGRYYYNLNKRNNAGKPTINFSGNYIAAFYRYNTYQYLGSYSSNGDEKADSLLHNVHYLGGWWGLQRNMGEQKLFYFNISFGPGLRTDFDEYVDFTIEGNLGLGIQW